MQRFIGRAESTGGQTIGEWLSDFEDAVVLGDSGVSSVAVGSYVYVGDVSVSCGGDIKLCGVKDDIKEKGLSADDVYDRATWRRISSYIDPTYKWE